MAKSSGVRCRSLDGTPYQRRSERRRRSRARRPDNVMNTHRTGTPAAVGRGHLQLVGPSTVPVRPVAPEAPACPTARERRTMTRVAALLRRRAGRLPEDSVLRAELLETAEYYAAGAEEAFAAPEPRRD